jgi:hypothetical protein
MACPGESVVVLAVTPLESPPSVPRQVYTLELGQAGGAATIRSGWAGCVWASMPACTPKRQRPAKARCPPATHCSTPPTQVRVQGLPRQLPASFQRHDCALGARREGVREGGRQRWLHHDPRHPPRGPHPEEWHGHLVGSWALDGMGIWWVAGRWHGHLGGQLQLQCCNAAGPGTTSPATTSAVPARACRRNVVKFDPLAKYGPPGQQFSYDEVLLRPVSGPAAARQLQNQLR